MVEGLVKILIMRAKVRLWDFLDTVKLATNAAQYLCPLCGRGQACILYISSSMLE